MAADFFKLLKVLPLRFVFDRKWLFVQFSGGPYSKLRPAGLRGKACHSSECISLYGMSPSGVWLWRRGAKVNDLWIASHCAWSYALLLLAVRKITKERTVNGPDSIQFWMLPRRNSYLCAGQNICLSRSFLSIAACTLSTSIQV